MLQRKKCLASVSLAVVLMLCPSALADRLILNDGTILIGKVTKKKDKASGERTYTIVTREGDTFAFPKSEVDKLIVESMLSDSQLFSLYDEWYGLVRPVLDNVAPEPSRFLNSWRRYSGYCTHGGGWDKPPHTDAFVSEWAKYTAHFAAVEKSVDYKRLTSAKAGSESLRDFVNHPSESGVEMAEMIELALDGFKKCGDLASRSDKSLRLIPTQQRKLVKAVRNKISAYERARSRSSDRARERAQRLHGEIPGKISKLRNTIEKQTQRVDNLINQFAQQRIIAASHIDSVLKHLGGITER